MIQIIRTTIWKDFFKCFKYKYIVLKICSLNHFQRCSSAHSVVLWTSISRSNRRALSTLLLCCCYVLVAVFPWFQIIDLVQYCFVDKGWACHGIAQATKLISNVPSDSHTYSWKLRCGKTNILAPKFPEKKMVSLAPVCHMALGHLCGSHVSSFTF